MKILIIFLSALSLNSCFTPSFKLTNSDMAPAIKTGDSVYADPDYYNNHEIKRFDIVVVKDPEGNLDSKGHPVMYVKRVIAFGGETFEIKNQRYYVNGRALDLPFKMGAPEMVDNYGPLNVLEGEYFVMSDSLGRSLDSRYWRKPVLSKDGIYGKVTSIKDGISGKMKDL